MFNEPSHEAVRDLLRAMAGRSVLVVGDAMLDNYLFGSAARISPEAPVQVVQLEREENLLGGAANVAKCLVALGAKVRLCAVIGNDAYGDRFLEETRSLGIDSELVFRDPGRPTPVKTRIISGRQQLLRVDRELQTPYPAALMRDLCARARDAVASSDAVLLSDYDKGVLHENVCETLIKAAHGKPVLVDPKGIRWQRYAGATVLKPNWREAKSFLASRDSMVLSLQPHTNDGDAEAMAEQLCRGLCTHSVLITRDAQGLSLVCADQSRLSLRTRARQVQDETGAGDIVAAVTCLALAAGADLKTSVWLANIAAGAKVGKIGTQAVCDYEILEMLGEQFPSSQRKVLTLPQAVQLAATLRGGGKRVVFTNGCFDILHVGHVTYLENARRLGDALIVGINTDASVRRLKGPARPMQGEADRARIIASQACVDGVVLFGGDTPCELIRTIKPDVLCKGGDYKSTQDVVGWEIVQSYGGKVVLVDLVEGRSSSKVIEKARN